jgi:hypothetical protein
MLSRNFGVLIKSSLEKPQDADIKPLFEVNTALWEMKDQADNLIFQEGTVPFL